MALALEAPGFLHSPARELQQRLTSLWAPSPQESMAELRREALSGREVLVQRVAAAAVGVGGMLRPRGEAGNDDLLAERLVNVATSLPFLGLGLHMHRSRHSAEAKQYAAAIMAVGVVATAYHASSGRLRSVLRKADYWTITVAGAALSKAVHRDRRWARRAIGTSMLAVPFFPFHLSAAHTLATQAEFARCARHSAPVRRAFRLHAATASAAIAAFALEDRLAERGVRGAHAVWHVLSCASVATLGALVEHKEGLRRGEGSPHDSVASLDRLGGGSPKAKALD
ncbi:hypothetical protein ACKKBG_A27585 [Auxenochlorella protothecoides x Auxenochlorella symbiontica]